MTDQNTSSKIISTENLKDLIDNEGDYKLIDVREPYELIHGVIPTSKNIPLNSIKDQLQNFNKDDNLIFYCRTGSRSDAATKLALENGYSNSVNYKGSIWAWSEIDNNVKRYGPGA